MVATVVTIFVVLSSCLIFLAEPSAMYTCCDNGLIEDPKGDPIVATEIGPSKEVADPSPKIVVTLLTFFFGI